MAQPTTPVAPLLGGRYRHVRELGRGAIGRVVLVEDVIAGGARAAKIVGAEHGERLRWELSLLTALAHPNVAAVHELLRLDAPAEAPFALDAGAWVLIEELAPGRASDAIARSLELEDRARFAIAAGAACARALAAVHAAGLVHGDVKPANIVVPDAPVAPSAARLVDFGLAGPPGHGPVAGTPAFLAPEAWLGQRSAAGDLFALGVTLHRWISPEAADGSASSAAGDAARGARPGELPAGIPAPLRALIAELLHERPEERPAGAREVARRLETIAGGDQDASAILDEPTRDERARRIAVIAVRGREREIAALRAAIDAPGVVLVHGPPGAGRTRVLREAVRALQAERAAAGAQVPTWIAGALPDRVSHAAIVHDESATLTIERALADVRAAELDGVALVVVLERDTPAGGASGEVVSIEDPAVRTIAVGPLDDGALGAVLGDALSLPRVSAALMDAARSASSGLPGRLCRLIAGALAEGRDPARPEVLRGLGREESTALAIPEPCRALAEALAIAGGTLSHAEAASLDAGSLEAGSLDAGSVETASLKSVSRRVTLLAASGLATFDADGLGLRPDRMLRVLAELGPARRRAIARSLDRLVRRPLARACVDAELGRDGPARAQLLALASAARDAGDPLAAADLLRLARERISAAGDAVTIALADALRAAGDDREALEVIATATRDRPEDRPSIALHAELARLAGDSDRADQLAASIDDELDDASLAARCVRARIAWARGEHDVALARARAVVALAHGRGPLAARAHEVAALVMMSRHDAAGASAEAAAAERAAGAMTGALGLAAQSRGASIAGSAALAAGAPERARAAYERAADLAERAGERHASASATVNLGLARLDAGLLGPAITSLREGARRLASLRRPRELGRALFNLANAAFLAGDDALAALAGERARVAAAEVGDRDAAALAGIVLADLEVRAGRVRSAIRMLERIDAEGPARALTSARLAMACAALGAIEDAQAHSDAARAHAEGIDALEAEVAIAAARVSLAAGEAPLAETAAVRAMASARSFETRVRAALVGAEAADACGNRGEGAARLAVARSLLDAASAGLEPSARARLRAVASYQRALAARPDPSAAEHPSARRDGVLALARRVTAEHRPSRVLDALASAALELTGAERAFVLARAGDGSLEVRIARGLAGVLGAEHRPSRSIAARVIDERRSMVSVDAIDDARLDRVASVHALALRSVLAVPIATRDAGTLALYVDDRLRPAAFDEDTVRNLSALADLGAAALASAERWRDERRAARVHARRARTLEQMLDARGEELRTLRAPFTGPFEPLVATSEAMRRVITLASRVAASGISVLLVGESGTGKEMLARAIHAASVRRDRAFVGESCAAIPEGLLESTLFGHVRGAFTGADRARRGLFEIADGGTLFLDEIAETSPGMQAKLLRVLQEGEVRAVGSERTRTVDVRTIAATSRDLATRITENRFREDLYYRLAVVTIELPPLRERVEDIAPLAASFVARYAPGRRVRIDERALEILRGARWPGNVRQLENEMRRALLVARDAIEAEHLSPELGGAGHDAGDELDLKARVQSLEKTLVLRALAIHDGNQTRAARALGLSRFGLQKMLKRFDRAEEDTPPD